MKELMKKICITAIVALLGVVSLMKADSADGASATQIAINNIVNIQLEDQFGNAIDFGSIGVKDASGSDYVYMYLNTGNINEYGPRVCKMGEESEFYYTDFQKYISSGTVTGISSPDINVIGYDYSNIRIDKGISKVRVWYRPNQTDYTLDANKAGLYVDAAWKNALTCSIDMGSKNVNIKNTTGLSLYSLSAGTHSGQFYYGTNRSTYYHELKTSATKTEYVKKKIKLSEVDSRYFTSDGSVIHNNVITKIGSNDSSKIAMLVCFSGGMVTIPVPDSQGYVEVYVEKSTGEVNLYLESLLNGMTGLGYQKKINAYFHIDMDVQLKAEPNEGSTVMGVEAGKYTVNYYPGSNQYAKISSYPIEVKNSDNVQTFKIVVHKHVYDTWKSDGINHWKECCDIKNETSNHSWSTWVIDKEATETAEGSKHRICTVCNYKATAVISKLSHTHKPSTVWSTDSNYHWKECSCGNISSKSTHSYGTWVIDKAATEDATGIKHRNCTICNYKETQIIDKLPHTHKHSTKWSSDSTSHWYECSCGDKKSLSSHVSKNEATETTAKICDTCGYIIEPAIGHVNHIADTGKFYNDEDTHWYKCNGCNQKLEEKAHSFEWIIDYEATEEMAGQKHEECSGCGYKKEAVEIPQIIIETEPDTEEPTEEPTEPDTTVTPTETEQDTESETEIQKTKPEKDNDYKMIFIILGIVTGIGAVSALIIFLFKKKKKR